MSSGPGTAIPGTSVPIGALLTPGGIQGAQGPSGSPSFTTTTADFTMPPAGSTVQVTVVDASWVIVGEMVSVQTAGGSPTQAASLRVQAKSGNQLTLLYQPPAAMPLANTTQPGLLNQLSGKASDYVGGDNNTHPLGAPLQFLTAAYNLTGSDNNKFAVCSGGSWVLGLPAPVVGMLYRIRNDQGISGTTGTITITPASGTIDGLASLLLLAGQEVTVFTDGTNWRSFGRQRRCVLGTVDMSAGGGNGGSILLPPGYTYFNVTMNDLVSNTSQGIVVGQVSIDGGNTWIGANYYELNIYNTSNTAVAATIGGTPAANFFMTSYLYNGRQIPGVVNAVLYPGDANNGFSWSGVYSGWQPAGQMCWQLTAIINAAPTGRMNALRYLPGGGQLITAGLLTLEGIV